MSASPAARRLARFARGLRLADVPPPVVARAQDLVLDTLGCALAASTMDFGRAISVVAARLGGPPEAVVIGRRARVAAANAVLANATLAHGLDFDDTLEGAIVHTGCVVVPTALAVGEAAGASGPAVLEAVVVGVEVMARLGLAAPGALHARHFHPTAVLGPFAAAAAAGRLLGLDEEALTRALGIAGSQASGIIAYLDDGTWTKRLHPGWAAHAGVVAASLAAAGFSGPARVLESPHGFYAAFAGGEGAAELEAQLATLGARWALAALAFKPYPCGSIAQPYMDCARRLRAAHALRPEAIVAVRCRTAPGPVPRLWEPLAAKRRPPNGYAAQFSLPYLVARVLVHGEVGLADFTDEAVGDPRVLDLAARVEYEVDPAMAYPRRFSGHVAVHLADGQVVEAWQEHPRGGPAWPMTPEELRAKFTANARLRLPPAAAARVVDEVAALPERADVGALADALAG